MSIIEIFICDGCRKEYRKFDNEQNNIILKIEQDYSYMNAGGGWHKHLEKIKVICDDCAGGLDKTITKFFDDKKEAQE